jgi:hypothetical protein
MMKKICLLIIFLSFDVFAQPVPSHYYKLWQKDSLYYFLTDQGILKFYSSETSGEFFLTRYVEGNFNSSMTIAVNNDHLFLARNDSVDVYSNINAYDLSYQSTFVPEYNIYSIHGFGPYLCVRTGDIYNLLKVIQGNLVPLTDTLFTHPPQELVFFTYPYVIRAHTVYKYVEGFDFYAVGNVGCGNTKTGLYDNKLVCHFYYQDPYPPYNVECILYIFTIEEPDFPFEEYDGWGINISQLHTLNGQLIPKKNLYYFSSGPIILTRQAQVAYMPSSNDNVAITDNYIFLLGDSARYSKWYAGSTFYPLIWTDVTDTKYIINQPSAFTLFQNYPNPFNPTTKIRYQIPELSKVKLTVYDVLGREVTTLVNEEKPAGVYEVEFDGANLPSGVYFYRIEAEKYSETKKFILLK